MPDEQLNQGDAGSTGAGASGQQQTTQPGTTSGSTNQATQQTGASNDGQARTGAIPGQTGQPAQQPAAQQFDPKDFIPRHRFNEVSNRIKTIEQQNQDLSRRLTLALGGQPSDPQQQKTEQLRNALFQVFPQLRRLSDLSEEQLEAVLQTPQHFEHSAQAEMQQWERHGDQQIEAASARVAEAIGVDNLDADQQSDLRLSLRHFLETKAKTELRQAADRYGDEAVARDNRRFSATIQRYEKGDPKLLDEFVSRYTKNWVEPARRTATARTSTRTRAVPESGNRQAVTSIQRPASFKNWDERLDFAAKIAKERGLVFDR